jgi:hypothetical protein
MTPEEFFYAMRKVSKDNTGDPEAMHCDADDLMCKVLTELGYGAGIEVFNKMTKWYA